MMFAQEQAIVKAQQRFDQLIAMARQAAENGRTADSVERELWTGLLEVGQGVLEGAFRGYGTGDLGPTMTHEGRVLHRLPELHTRRYVSVFGEICLPRTVYGTRESQKHEVVPLDAALALPEDQFSYLLQDWDQAFCVHDAYEPSRGAVEHILGIGQSVRTLEHMNGSMARTAPGYLQAQQGPGDDRSAGEVLAFTADGRGVPMRQGDAPGPEPSHGRRKKGEKANKKREACVGSVYSVDRFVRSADAIINETLRETTERHRPRPENKEVRASLTQPVWNGERWAERKGKEAIFEWFAEEAANRNPDGDRPMVCLIDGDEALRRMAQAYLPENVVLILDLYHVLERLWLAAYCFHAEGSDAAEAFVTERLRQLLEGRAGRMIGGLRQMASKHGLRGAKRRQLDAVIRYLERHREMMCYDQYLAAGYPIGSGIAEGGCGHLVRDRMEKTGMRWRIDSAQGMLNLRSIYINGAWRSFQEHRMTKETERLYPERDVVTDELRKQAA